MTRPVSARPTATGAAVTISGDAMTDLLLHLAESWPDVEARLADAHAHLGHAAACRWADEPDALDAAHNAKDAVRQALDGAGWAGGYTVDLSRYDTQDLASDLLATGMESLRGRT